MTLTLTLDPRTEADLHAMSAREGTDASLLAARLLARAVRAARPRPVYDIEALKTKYAEFAAEDLALSEATVAEHAALLAAEDAA